MSSPKSTSLACLNCRERHLKCDGGVPCCGRCFQTSLHCYYAPSRRGRKTRPAILSSLHVNERSPGFEYVPTRTSPLAEILDGFTDPLDTLFTDPMDVIDAESINAVSNPPAADQVTYPEYSTETMRINGRHHLIQVYYTRFHPAHPFLLPIEELLRLNPPDYLLQTLEFVASHYVSVDPLDRQSKALKDITMEAEASLYKVQALLVQAILAHSRSEPGYARNYLSEAVKAALKLGLNHRESDELLSHESDLYRESMRRTWWELFVTDSLLAALQHKGQLIIDADVSDVPLPCEEEKYSAGGCLLSNQTFRHLNDRFFAAQEDGFSSFSYRIDAATILRQVVMCVRSNAPIAPHIYHMLDSKIMAWFSHLPARKQSFVHNDGSVDEMMFQAHLLAHCAAIFLNLPHSYLLSPLLGIRGLICGSPSFSVPFSPGKFHTVKVLKAAESVSELACLPVSALQHTPFFTCLLVMSSIVHLGSCSFLEAAIAEKHRHYLALNTGVLKNLGDIWPLALLSTDHIKQAARDILSIEEPIQQNSILF